MKAIVFGGTGFIGSHVVEQLKLADHEVTVAVRKSSDTRFLRALGVHAQVVNFNDPSEVAECMRGKDVVYNCTAGAKVLGRKVAGADVEIKLTRELLEAASAIGVSKFIQLSTIVLYDFKSSDPFDESYISKPEYPIQEIEFQREQIVQQYGKSTGLETMILRPASTIGARDHSSFFLKLYEAHKKGRYPILGNGNARVSLVDTRDIGRAMTWLGTHQKSPEDTGIYNLKGFDTTWGDLKEMIDVSVGSFSRTIKIPRPIAWAIGGLAEYMTPATKEPPLSRFAVQMLTVNRLWDDKKIRSLGFTTKYGLKDAVGEAIHDFRSRQTALNH